MKSNEEKEDRTKRLIIIAILLAFLACSFGFAAYSRTVDLIVDRRGDSYVVYKGGVLSINPNKPENGIVKPVSYGGVDAEEATLTENGIININVHFTKPGQKAVYSFYGVNPTNTISYLNSVIFGDKYCTALGETTKESADRACDDIVMQVKVKNDVFDGTVGVIDNHILPANSNETISVTIKYDPKSTVEAYGANFKTDFGISTITYSDVD